MFGSAAALVAVAIGAAAAPMATTTTATTTATSAAAADLSTPKAAAKALFNAISAGDRDAVRDALFAADEPQRQLAGAMADFIVSGRTLGMAARARFGKEGDPIGRG